MARENLATMSLGKSLALLLASLLLSFSAWALDLSQAKQQGLVGEQTNGYLGAVHTPPSGEVQRLINEINNQRRQAYQQIAVKNGISLEQVAKLAAEKAIEKTPPGQYVQDPKSGHWLKK